MKDVAANVARSILVHRFDISKSSRIRRENRDIRGKETNRKVEKGEKLFIVVFFVIDRDNG